VSQRPSAALPTSPVVVLASQRLAHPAARSVLLRRGCVQLSREAAAGFTLRAVGQLKAKPALNVPGASHPGAAAHSY
jgi:hypothetical protein